MKDTYLKIFSNAEQLIGLPPMTQLQIDQINNQAMQLVFDTQAKGVCCGDCNENAPTFQNQPGDLPGYACCGPSSGGGEGPEGFGEPFSFVYNSNGWLYPCNLEANPPQFFPQSQSPGGTPNYTCPADPFEGEAIMG